jgi:hypothetical protein
MPVEVEILLGSGAAEVPIPMEVEVAMGPGAVAVPMAATEPGGGEVLLRPTAAVDAKCVPSAKHTASRTSWLHACKESQDVPVNFPEKLTKDNVVKYQSLELAGWYQTVPYLRLGRQTG